ncbi:MAG: nucleotide-binding universal stress UspA family protein [Saprospiraceae bacterium]|jgi:nucleotide-binding universal stress UspA family protein
MKHINNILVASELNKESYEALAYGITLGLMYDAKVSCIHVVKPSPLDIIKETFHIGSAKYGEALIHAKEESQNLLGHIIDVIAKELGVGEVNVDLKIVNGALSKCIMDHAEKIKADVVIIGTEPGSRFSRTAHTNLAINMIASEKANVLLIPSEFKMERIEQLGAFVNFEVEEVDFIHKMINHAKKTENGIKLIHVIEHGESVEKAKVMQESFERLFAKEIRQDGVKFELELGALHQVVNDLKAKHGIDLMVIRAYKRHWDMYTSSTSFSDKVIRNIKSPLMIWKNTRKVKRIIVEDKLKGTLNKFSKN